jgi:hypothetical protein
MPRERAGNDPHMVADPGHRRPKLRRGVDNTVPFASAHGIDHCVGYVSQRLAAALDQTDHACHCNSMRVTISGEER